MTRMLQFATSVCGVLLLNFAVFAATIPSIQGEVFDVSAEAVLSGESVELFLDDGNAVFDAGDSSVGITTTNATGRYVFEGLDANASYFVVHDGEISGLQTPGGIGFLIDEFDITQSVVADPVSSSRMGSISGPSNTMLGGTRDMYIEVNGGIAEGKLRANPFSLNSNLQIDMASGVTGRAVVTWDGVPGTTGMDPDHGLGMDFTGSGLFEGISISLAVDAAGAGQLLQMLVHSGEGATSMAEIEFPVEPNVEPVGSFFVPFTSFVGDATFDDVSSFQLLVDADKPSLDAQIDMIGLQGPSKVNFAVVPEPSGLLVAMAGIVAALGYRGRRRRRN